MFGVLFFGSNYFMWSQESEAGLNSQEKSKIASRMTDVHMPFITNDGQTDERVRFYAKSLGGTVFITEDAQLVYYLPKFEKAKKPKGWVIKENFVGASVSSVKGEDLATTKVNYFTGKDPSKWKKNISTFGFVSLGEIYNGIELKLKAHRNNVEKFFYIKPFFSPEIIRVRIQGARNLNVNDEGELEVETALGLARFTKPVRIWGTLLTKLNYIFAILLIALEIADVVTPSWRATSSNGTP